MTAGLPKHEAAALPLKLRRSLSAKLLLLTILFVFIAEIFVLIPSVSKHRLDWLQARIEAAYLVGLALEAPRGEMVDEATAGQLFVTADILGVIVTRDGARIQIFAPTVDPDADPPPMHYIDLGEGDSVTLIGSAWATFFSRGDDMVRVIGAPMYRPDGEVDILVSQRALRRNLLAYARNILGLSLVISTITALLVYVALRAMIVRPVQRLSRNMTAFQASPEDEAAIVSPSGRQDEIGAAERSLAALETRIQELLAQRRRLAALGAGISKISHDLRNILASAQLMSDRLAKSDDPRVRKLSPRLIQALDRAIALSRDTLSYGRLEPGALSKSKFSLRALVDEVFDDAASTHVGFVNETPDGLELVADRNQLYRALANLVTNAVEAMTPPEAAADGAPPPETPAKRVVIGAEMRDGAVAIRVADDGPGLPEEARAHLFEPFRGSSKPGGSGLGVAISHEIARAHRGALALESSGPDGATFLLTLPA